MIVLVNEQSASASEIVSGALQDHGRARILGTRTFGKGSVQEIRQLEGNRGILKFTTGHYVLPSGRRIDRAMVDVTGAWGVAPSPGLRVHETDAAMAQRLRARREHRRITEDASAPACPDPAWIRTTMHDELLAVAAEVLTDRVRRGAWPQRFDEDDPASVAHRNEIDRLEALRGRLAEQLIEMEDRLDVLHAESHGGA